MSAEANENGVFRFDYAEPHPMFCKYKISGINRSLPALRSAEGLPVSGLRGVAVGPGAPHQQENHHTDQCHAENPHIGPVPPIVLGYESQSHARRAAESP